jgi:ATP-dependent helicase/nuclease subunit A
MFQVLHSSAGAGKTHALVKHYIALCMDTSDPGAYRSILALTFTNKAASEMKERVMGYLRKIAKSELQEGAITDVVQHLRQRTGLGNEALAQRADALLRHMLHHWSEVAISTIDAFTRRVVQPFARDLQLDHDLRMTTEQDRYLNGAVDALVATAGVDPTITSILTEACLQLLHDEQRWDPESPLRALSGELQKESSIAPLGRLGDMDVDTVKAIGKGLRLQEVEFREKVRSIGREALDLLTKHGIQAGDLVHGANGIHSTFRKLAHFERSWEPPGPNARKPITSGKWHSGKASATTIAALEGLAPRLRSLFEKAEMLMAEEHPLFLMRQAVARELPATFALRALETHLERLKQEDGVAFFSDLTRKVARIVASEPVPFIYERLGERYQHYLIDEFQDTSLMQWTCLLPLVDNALSTGGSALLVGDAKQAIYRWRNGEVRLFVELPDLFGNTGPGDRAGEHLTAGIPTNGSLALQQTLIACDHRPEQFALWRAGDRTTRGLEERVQRPCSGTRRACAWSGPA